MKKYWEVLKTEWKRFLLMFIVITMVCFGILFLNNEQEVAEGKTCVTGGIVVSYDITTLDVVGDGTIVLYDYVSMWNNEELQYSFIEKLDNSKNIYTLAPEWDEMSGSDKIDWINQNIKVSRLSTSAMYAVSYSKEVAQVDFDETREAIDELLGLYKEYADELVKMADENVESSITKEFSHEELVFSEQENTSNQFMYLVLSVIFAFMLTITYLCIRVVIKTKK